MKQPKERFTHKSLPLVSLLLLLLTFGVMIPVLGLYWDDWPVIAAARLKDISSFWEFYSGERPFSAWTYILTIPMLGTHPIAWHIFTLILRWLSVLTMWWALIGLWPGRKREVTWTALLFAIYPVFTQQPVAVAFNQHWMTFTLYFVSLGAMIYSLRKPRWFWLFFILALATEMIHVLTMEYFWGLELLRPVILWFMVSEQTQALKDRFRKTLYYWLPYLGVLIIGFWLRMTVFVDLAKDPNRPDLLYSLVNQPVSTLLRLAQLAIQDLTNNLISAWYVTFAAEDVRFQDSYFWFSILVSVVIGFLTYYYLSRLSQKGEDLQVKGVERDVWLRQAILLGFLGAMLGPVPVWLSDRQVLWGIYGGRFGLAAEFGLSILIVALLDWLTIRMRYKLVILAVIMGLAAGYHIRNAAVYRQSTIKQQQFFWQLFWRAPYIEPGTAILSADELFPYVGRYATSLTLNLLYPQSGPQDEMDYWFIELSYDIAPKNIPLLREGMEFDRSFRNFQFKGNSLESLALYYKSGTGRCLWILSEDDYDRPGLPELTQQVVSISRLDRVKELPVSDEYPASELFGKEPEHEWCYYYQKAELARQLGDWDKVVLLAAQAEEEGFSPQAASEWSPFIEGYGKLHQWEHAIRLTEKALDLDAAVAPLICRTWQRLTKDQPPADTISRTNLVLQPFGCSLP